MTNTDPFTPDRPFNTTLTDVTGSRWHFCYWGSGNVYIRETPEGVSTVMIGAFASRDTWPYLIDLNYYGLRPEDVTAEWLDKRAAEWISDRNEDIEKGNI